MALTKSAIELWLVDLERCAGPLERLERRAARLADEDRERAQAIKDARERRGRLAAYTALRVLLERFAGLDVRGAPFLRIGGRPRLDVGDVEFSLSHIDGLALIGVSSAIPLGVDIERVRPVRMTASRMMDISAAGAGLCDRPLPASGSARAFLQAWTRLEAFSKARGRALSQTLIDVGIRGMARRKLAPVEIEARARRTAHDEGIVVHDVKLSPALLGAVGTLRGASPVRAKAFPANEGEIERLLARVP